MSFSHAPGRFIAAAAVMLLACSGASAQTAPELQIYRSEVTVPFTNIGASPALNVNPADIQAIQGGALEIRHSVVFTAPTRRLSVRTFLVAPGSPNPTPPAAQTMLRESYEVNVEQTLWAPMSVVPPGTTNSLVIVGRIAGGGTSVGGDLTGKLFVHSLGYDAANRNNPSNTEENLNNVTSNVVGRYTMYAQEGLGTVGYASDSSGPGPEPPAFSVTASAGTNTTTALSQIQLTATVANAEGTVSYSWRTTGKSAAIIGPTTATPSVQFAEGFGDYVFEVAATDAAGNRATSQVTVRYVGRF